MRTLQTFRRNLVFWFTINSVVIMVFSIAQIQPFLYMKIKSKPDIFWTIISGTGEIAYTFYAPYAFQFSLILQTIKQK
jgi:hypothetical protein